MHLDLLRTFLVVSELGSLNKAALRLRLSQSTLTRQIHALEHEIGGALFERGPSGMALTATGHTFGQELAPVLAQLDAALATARRSARGQSATLRIGYLASAAPEYLNPALTVLRREHPEVKVKLLDLSPGQQLAALDRGELDLGMIGHPGSLKSCAVYVRRLASLPVMVAMSEQHRLSSRRAVELADLKQELFVGAAESDLPGYDRWLVQVCRKARFRPRIIDVADSLSHSLSVVVTEGAVTLLPAYTKEARVPGVVFRPLADASITWDLVVVWQRGKIPAPVKAMLAALSG